MTAVPNWLRSLPKLQDLLKLLVWMLAAWWFFETVGRVLPGPAPHWLRGACERLLAAKRAQGNPLGFGYGIERHGKAVARPWQSHSAAVRADAQAHFRSASLLRISWPWGWCTYRRLPRPAATPDRARSVRPAAAVVQVDYRLRRATTSRNSRYFAHLACTLCRALGGAFDASGTSDRVGRAPHRRHDSTPRLRLHASSWRHSLPQLPR